MAFRTKPEFVRAVIEVPADVDLTHHIKTANTVVNYVVSQDTAGILNAQLQESIETYLAAHYYSLLDPQYVSKSTGSASGTFNKRDWWEEAKKLDLTGTLAGLGGVTASFDWLGKGDNEEVDYWDRN